MISINVLFVVKLAIVTKMLFFDNLSVVGPIE